MLKLALFLFIAGAASIEDQEAAIVRLDNNEVTRRDLQVSDISIERLEAIVAALRPDLELAKPRFGGPRPADIPESLGVDNAVNEQVLRWRKLQPLYTRAERALAAAEAALKVERAWVAFRKEPTPVSVENARGLLRPWCDGHSRMGNPIATEICSKRFRELDEKQKSLAVSGFDGGRRVPAHPWPWQNNRAEARFDLTAEGARLEFEGPLTDVELYVRRPGDAAAKLTLADCSPAKGPSMQGSFAGAPTSVGQCAEIAVQPGARVRSTTLGPKDSVWVRGAPGPVVVIARPKGAPFTATERLIGVPPEGSPPSQRVVGDYAIRGFPGGSAVPAHAMFAAGFPAFVVYVNAETKVRVSGNREDTLRVGEPVMVNGDSSVMRANGQTAAIELSSDRQRYFTDRGTKPVDTFLTTTPPTTLTLPPIVAAEEPHVSSIWHDIDLDAFEGIEDKRVKALLKVREPLKKCLIKDVSASGNTSGLDLVTYNADGTVRRVESFTQVVEQRAAKRCKLAPFLAQRKKLLSTLEKEALDRTRKLLTTPASP